MGFGETIFLFLLALVIFGPKKLPEIARQVGRVLNEVKKASNEFKSQIETEVSNLEREEARKKVPAATPPDGAIVNRAVMTAQPALAAAPAELSPASAEPESEKVSQPENSAPADLSSATPAVAGQESHG